MRAPAGVCSFSQMRTSAKVANRRDDVESQQRRLGAGMQSAGTRDDDGPVGDLDADRLTVAGRRQAAVEEGVGDDLA